MGFETRVLVDQCINDMCLQAPRSRFYPTAIQKRVQLPLEDVFVRLVTLSQENVLVLRWELRCPCYDCVETVETFDKIPDTLGYDTECAFGHEFKVDFNVIFPVLRINPDYQKYMASQLKKNKTDKAPKPTVTTVGKDVSLEELLQIPAVAKVLVPFLSPGIQTQYIVQGDMTMNNNNRTISGSFNGNGFQGNINQGDNVTQIGTWGAEQQSQFDELLAAITNHKDLKQDEKEEAIDTLNHLKESKAKGTLKEAKLKAMWELLPAVVKGLTVAGEVFATLHGA
ncbi:hypothetical protein NZD89_09415 [Alicyclobacillus fastidiosus]|uniref:Uncharacterized protein n=1 Tax=Alicyclobacillus fastidiosus TaxID=392011 RepID=A0ABY6ZKY0_9BACL|nr:hypothetical protein [Alicyclobacillus fastidiosus]WAH43575.1 hypothetical protein NZD89_09415 [Alicyclobacillus fastidiosus]GMA59753.1 hypothetical protein GCM10025859_01930 [Alicyclobacillus fastidiosus]